MRSVVEAAARAVLDRPDAWRWQALEPSEAERVMARVVAVAIGSETIGEATLGTPGAKALADRLTDLLRTELLEDSRGLSPRAVLQVIRRLDGWSAEMEPRERQELAFLLTGASALDLVVEFAHDLRSPLTSIMFLAETLRKGQSGEINDVQREQLGIVYSAALGMVGVANDLMDLARSEVDEEWGRSAEETFSLQELVASVRSMVAPMADQKRLDIAYRTPNHDSRVGHPILLSRVLLNLTTNAIKFTDRGRVDIVVEEQPRDVLVFSVTDTGRGMNPEALESLYTLFDRSYSGTGFHFSGTGLGLAICRRMVQVMGSELEVESRPGEGTRFYFELPLRRA